MLRILFLSADPDDADKLQVADEYEDIKDALYRRLSNDQIYIEVCFATSLDKLQENFLRVRPNIVHFSGHGTKSGKIVFKKASGNFEVATHIDLAKLFEIYEDTILCVILNACYSQDQAKSISKYINCSIGTSTKLSDDVARKFAKTFYLALAHGKSIEKAFDSGIVQIKITSDKDDVVETDAIHLICEKPGVDPSNVFIRPEKISILISKERNAEDLKKMGEFESALQIYEDIINLEPNNLHAWINKGECLQQMGKEYKALNSFDKAIELDPRNVNTWIKRGLSLSKQHEYDKAIRAFDKAIELDPDHVETWYQRGKYLIENRKYVEAVKDFDKAIELDPGHVSSWVSKGSSLNLLNRYDEAIRAFDKAIELDPLNKNREIFLAWFLRGKCLMENRKYVEAVKDFDVVLKERMSFLAISLHSKAQCMKETSLRYISQKEG